MDFSIALFWETYGQTIIAITRKIIIALLIIIGGRIVIFLSRHLHRAATKKLKADETLTSVLRMLIHYGVIIICFIMILDIFGVNTTGLIALLGAAGVAVGFALKDTLGNIASGIVILFLRPFGTGDFIECGSVVGSVREMGLFSTILETGDGVYISAPNSSLWGVPLRNYSRNEKRRMEISISISYSDSIDTAFQVLAGIISEESRFLKDPPAQVMVQSLGESGIGITLRAWVSSSDYWKVYWTQMKNVKEKIQEAGLTIAFPRREIHFVKET
ncbi:MAG: mechanosensitive ion channel family protein [Treponema sp.]|jgi:small conductance mechanosensitive channel|nr:mechanosensitive ion channel family protein [Treponema sp.]